MAIFRKYLEFRDDHDCKDYIFGTVLHMNQDFLMKTFAMNILTAHHQLLGTPEMPEQLEVAGEQHALAVRCVGCRRTLICFFAITGDMRRSSLTEKSPLPHLQHCVQISSISCRCLNNRDGEWRFSSQWATRWELGVKLCYIMFC